MRERFTFCARASCILRERATCKASREGGRDGYPITGTEGLFMLNEWNMLNGNIPAAVRKKGNYKFPSSRAPRGLELRTCAR